MDERTDDGQKDGQGDSYIPPPLGQSNLVPILPPAHPVRGVNKYIKIQ